MSSVLLWSCIGPVFGNQDFFVGLGVFFDTYSNHNGEHSVSRLVYYHSHSLLCTLIHHSIMYTCTILSLSLSLLKHEHPYISAMVNNGSLHYDHDRDGTHSQMAGCHVSIQIPCNIYTCVVLFN